METEAMKLILSSFTAVRIAAFVCVSLLSVMFKNNASRGAKRLAASKTNPSPFSSFPNSLQSSREHVVLSLYSPKSSKGKNNQSFIVKKAMKLQQSPDRRKDVPYSKRGELFAEKSRTKPDEDLLNMLKLTPTPKHTSSISVGDVRKRESPWSSPSSARPDRLRVAELESKLQRTTQRLKKLESSYKQLLVKQLTAEHGTPCDLDFFTRSHDSGQPPTDPNVTERLDRLEALCAEILERVKTLAPHSGRKEDRG